MSIRVVLTTVVPESSVRVYSVTLLDEDGAPVTLAAIDSFTVTLRDADTGFKLRDRQNVLNVNGGTMDATSGVFTLVLSSSDNRIVNPLKRPNTVERRVLTLDVVYNLGAKRETHEAEYPVEAFADV